MHCLHFVLQQWRVLQAGIDGGLRRYNVLQPQCIKMILCHWVTLWAVEQTHTSSSTQRGREARKLPLKIASLPSSPNHKYHSAAGLVNILFPPNKSHIQLWKNSTTNQMYIIQAFVSFGASCTSSCKSARPTHSHNIHTKTRKTNWGCKQS